MFIGQHPQSNWLVERFHRHLVSDLMVRHQWCADELPLVLHDISIARCAPKYDSGCSSAEMVYEVPLTVSGDFIPSVRVTQEAASFLRQLRRGVYTVFVSGDPTFVLDHGTRQDIGCIDRLKPAFLDPLEQLGGGR